MKAKHKAHKKHCERIIKQYGKNLKKSNKMEYERYRKGERL